ncbi:MAG: M56 family metallopeptidase [Planctomycetota bacterium]
MTHLDLSLAAVTHALGAAVVHFLWQGAVIGVLAAGALALIGRAHAPARYLVSGAAMGLCVLCFVVTCVTGLASGAPSTGAVTASSFESLSVAVAAAPTNGASAGRPVDTVAWLWLGGVVFCMVRFVSELAGARRLSTRGITTPEAAWLEVFDTIKRELGLPPSIPLLRSSLAEVPMVVGWLAPVVVVPAAAFTVLTPDQLRAVLAHELAHIRRRDHLFNAAQIVVESVLFFHPVTWWLSHQIRTEREHCCDDTAVRTTRSARILAEALTRLEVMRSTHPQATLAATGGPLMDRIARIVGVESRTRRAPLWRNAIALTAGAVVAVAGITQATAQDKPPAGDDLLAVLQQLALVTDPDDPQLRVLYDLLIRDEEEEEIELDEYLEQIEARIDAAVERGDLSPDEAEEKFDELMHEVELKAEMQFYEDVFDLSPEEAELKITRLELEDAVLAGEITRREADAELEELRLDLEMREEWGALTEERALELRAAVRAGELTIDEAKEEMEAFKEQLEHEFELRKAQARLDALVEAGEITQDQAAERLDAYRERLATHAEDDEFDWDAFEHRVESAVERGDITRDEADQIYTAMKERLEDEEDEEFDDEHDHEHDEHDDGERWRGLAARLKVAGVPRDKLEVGVEAVEKLAEQMRDEGMDFEISPDLTAWLEREDFDDDEVRAVMNLAGALAVFDTD